MLKHRKATNSIRRTANKVGKANGPGDALLAVGAVLAVGVAVLLLVTAIYMFLGVVVYFAWNLGVVNAAASAGGFVSPIGYWAAVGVAAVIGLLKSIFQRSSSTAS